MSIPWKDDYATGFRQIDKQHQQLFRFVNDLERLIRLRAFEPRLVNSVIHFLESYTKSHFAYEEGCMRIANCPMAKRNKDAHRRFLDFMEGWSQRYRENGASEKLLHELHATMEDWLIDHICKVDSHLKKCAPVEEQAKPG